MLISRAADNPSGGRDSHAGRAGGSGHPVVERYRLSAEAWCR